jgi:hypothetical protein
MKRMVGYSIAVVGLAVMALGLNIINWETPLLEGLSSNIIMIIGIAVVIVGVVISLKSGGGRANTQASEEVPIYEGTGKKRKIVGYRKN